jgi:hypothetical protein
MLETLTYEMFEPLIGQTFTLTNADQTLAFELTDVEPLPVPRRRSRETATPPKRAPFSLFFLGEPLLPQAMYPIQHDAFGSEPLTIFIVPVREVAGRGYEYEAVFT